MKASKGIHNAYREGEYSSIVSETSVVQVNTKVNDTHNVTVYIAGTTRV